MFKKIEFPEFSFQPKPMLFQLIIVKIIIHLCLLAIILQDVKTINFGLLKKNQNSQINKAGSLQKLNAFEG